MVDEKLLHYRLSGDATDLASTTQERRKAMDDEGHEGSGQAIPSLLHGSSHMMSVPRVLPPGEYRLRIADGLVFLDLDGVQALLDTGSPSSFDRDHAPFDPRKVPHHFDWFIGTDRFLGRRFLLDAPAGKLIVTDGPMTSPHAVPFQLVSGIPRASVAFDGRLVPAFLDTGATRTYVAPGVINGGAMKGVIRDFNPIVGEFEAELYRAEVAFAGRSRWLDVGQLNATLGSDLAAFGARAVLGTDFLLTAPFWFDFVDRKVGFKV